MSSTHVSENHNALHAPHYQGAVNLDTLLVSAANGLLTYPNPDQAVTAGYRRDVVHVNTPKDVPTDFFDSANAYFDVDLGTGLDSIATSDLRMTFTNADSGDTSFNSIPSNLISHYEVRVGDEIKETVTDLQSWMSQIPYTDPWTIQRQKTSSTIDPDTYKVSLDIAAGDPSNEVRIPLRNVLTACHIAPATIAKPLKYRFYSQAASNVVTNVTDFQLTEVKCVTHESRRLDSQLAAAAKRPMDYRYLQPKVQEKTVAFTAGATEEIVLSNFSPNDLCSHAWVLIRAQATTGLAKDNYLKNITNVWLEDENGQNMTNGIRWKGADLLDNTYSDKFENEAKNYHGLYLPFCPSTDPVADYKAGTQNGVQPLTNNMKLQITSSATATYKVSFVAMCPKHVRTESGTVTIM